MKPNSIKILEEAKIINLQETYPLGANLTMDALSRDPYPLYAQLQMEEPVTWVEELKMYYVVRHKDVDRILKDDERFVTGTPGSLIYDTFGEHMLTVEGKLHDFYKNKVRRPFMPSFIRENIETEVTHLTNRLIDSFDTQGQVELRSHFASRLPVQTMLYLFGLPEEDEQYLRRWYNSFEKALANFSWDEKVRSTAHQNVTEFHTHLQVSIERLRKQPDNSLLNSLVNPPEGERLSDEEIKRNASIIFFGGISTVEALILNTVYALSLHPDTFERVRDDLALIPQVLEEVIRWMAPVQSATRHVVKDCLFNGILFKKGDTVNCMLGAANRDPSVFVEPDKFDIDRPNLRQHLGFAIGKHLCLGSHLARAEARIALERLIIRLPRCQMSPDTPSVPEGYEFRQPSRLMLNW